MNKFEDIYDKVWKIAIAVFFLTFLFSLLICFIILLYKEVFNI